MVHDVLLLTPFTHTNGDVLAALAKVDIGVSDLLKALIISLRLPLRCDQSVSTPKNSSRSSNFDVAVLASAFAFSFAFSRFHY